MLLPQELSLVFRQFETCALFNKFSFANGNFLRERPEKRKKSINANLCRFNECDRSVYDNENLLKSLKIVYFICIFMSCVFTLIKREPLNDISQVHLWSI